MKKHIISLLLSFSLVLTSVLSPASAAPINSESQLDQQALDMGQSALREVLERREQLLDSPRLDESLVDRKDGLVKVIVELSKESVALEKGIAQFSGEKFTTSMEDKAETIVENEQRAFERRLQSKGIDYKVNHKYAHALNGVALEIDSSKVDELLEFPEVLGVYLDSEVHLDPVLEEQIPTGNTASFIGAPAVWDLGYTGKGIKVGVLDTGIDYYHPALVDAYKGGYDAADNDSDPYDEIDNHGTHVAGIIAARSTGDNGVVGIAPESDIYAYRVFGVNSSRSTISAGINRAVEDHMDIINLSLMVSNDPNNILEVMLNNAVLAGTVVVVASGNAGPHRYTTSSTSPFVITVGSSTGPSELITANASFTTLIQDSTISNSNLKPVELGDVDLDTPAVSEMIKAPEISEPDVNDQNVSAESQDYRLDLLAWDINVDPETQLTNSYEVVHVDPFNEEDLVHDRLEGKVALIEYDGFLRLKTLIVKAREAGAVAAIIYDNISLDPIDELYDNYNFIPTFGMTNVAGVHIKELLDQGHNVEVSFTDFNKKMDLGDKISYFSSRGPVRRNLDIKPDVVAPGAAILSTVPAYGRDIPDADYSQAYERISGTSMAAPVVAGLAALLLDKHPDWTPFDVKVAIMNNAKVLDTVAYDVFDQGAGRIQALQTVQATALAKVMNETTYIDNGIQVTRENVTGSINFGHFNKQDQAEVTKQIVVQALTDNDQDYTVDIKTTRSVPGVEVTVDKSEFTLNGEEQLLVTLTVPADLGMDDIAELQGYIYITSGAESYSIPFVAHFNKDIKHFSISSATTESNLLHFPLTANGDLDSVKLNIEFYTPMETVMISLHELSKPEDNGDIVYRRYNQPFSPNRLHEIDWNGQIIDFYDQYSDNPVLFDAPDGIYNVKIISHPLNRSLIDNLESFSEPIIIKRTAPQIHLSTDKINTSTDSATITGTVEDLYIKEAPVLNKFVEKEVLNVTDALQAAYTVRDSNNEDVSRGKFEIQQDGTFELNLTGLSNGTYTVDLEVEDLQGLKGTTTLQLEVNGSTTDNE